MATSSVSSTTSSSLNVSSLGTGTPLQITGLASGLDTNSIIQELMAIQQQPVTNLQNEQKGIQALNTNLQSIQSSLQSLVTSAQALSSTSLFANQQTVSSSNSTLVSAATTSAVGAVVGGYQIGVSALATSAQQTFSYTPQTGTNSVTIGWSNGTTSGSQTYPLQAGATSQDIVNAVNADSSGSVWGTVVNGNIVFSDRTTGSQSSFTASDGSGALTSQGTQSPGTNAAYAINGGSTQYSQSNTLTSAIAGVNLTLGGVTTGGPPVTVSVSAPSLSTSAIQGALQNFVSAYNSVLSQVSSQLTQAPSSSDPTQGTLYGDPGLQGLLNTMRQVMYSTVSGLSPTLSNMTDLGVSTGASTGSASPSQTAISGQLTLNATTLSQAITSNPGGVTALLKSWSQSFSDLVNPVAQAGGTIDTRVQGDNLQITNLGNQITTMQAALADKQTALQQQFAALEAALSQNQSTSTWLTSQISSLPG